jgi:hypothetical protein
MKRSLPADTGKYEMEDKDDMAAMQVTGSYTRAGHRAHKVS